MRNFILPAPNDAQTRSAGPDHVAAPTDINTEPSVAAPAPTGSVDDLANYLTDGYWNDNGGSRHAFDTSTSNVITVNITGLTTDGQRLARWAMEAWEAVANIRFVETSGSAKITFTDNQPGAYSSYSAIGGITQSATVNVSTNWLNVYGSQIDDYTFPTYLHELGHALGLGHQGNYNGAATFGLDETFANDSYQVSLMSYFSQTENTTVNASYGQPITAMIADIVAIQSLYGAPGGGSSTAGDTVYGVGQTIGGYLGTLFDALLSDSDPNNYYGDGPVALTLYDLSGTDTVDLSTDTTNQNVDLNAEGIWNVRGLIGNVVVGRGTVIENFVAGSGHDQVIGNAADNALSGNAGNDTLSGGAGDDLLNGGGGADVLIGGTGNDTVSYEGSYGSLRVDMLYPQLNTNIAAGDTYFDIENLTGSRGFDNLRGTYGDNYIRGMANVDYTFGRRGDDTLDGGIGDDVLFGGVGQDVLIGGANRDRAQYSESLTALLLDLADPSRNTGEAAGDVYVSIEDLAGGSFADTIYGDADDNRLFGREEEDQLFGRAGDDYLNGGSHADTLDGGAGNDTLRGGNSRDTFIFNDGQDVIEDFFLDTIEIDRAVWAGTLDALLSGATVENGNLILDFGNGNNLTLNGITDVATIENYIIII